MMLKTKKAITAEDEVPKKRSSREIEAAGMTSHAVGVNNVNYKTKTKVSRKHGAKEMKLADGPKMKLKMEPFDIRSHHQNEEAERLGVITTKFLA
jgi:hypothetical protein